MVPLLPVVVVSLLLASSAHAQRPRVVTGWETACGLLVADVAMVPAISLTNKAPNCCWVPLGTQAGDVVEMCTNKTGGATYPIP
jgi:hypothetical protein